MIAPVFLFWAGGGSLTGDCRDRSKGNYFYNRLTGSNPLLMEVLLYCNGIKATCQMPLSFLIN